MRSTTVSKLTDNINKKNQTMILYLCTNSIAQENLMKDKWAVPWFANYAM